MVESRSSRARRVRRPLASMAVFALAAIAAAGLFRGGLLSAEPAPASLGAMASFVAPVDSASEISLADSLFGFSGKLRARLLPTKAPEAAFPFLSELLGEAVRVPGVHPLAPEASDRPFAFISLVPFTAKRNGRIGSYRIGAWPGETRRMSGIYANPEGFITVTPENKDIHISENFRLRDFLTKDQHDVWPKYLVLNLGLVDKLELVLADLRERGYRAERMSVLSGFRTPQYNGSGNTAGRSNVSRHMFGDAADVFIDNEGNGRMSDLNRDGRINERDARIMLESVERVERRHPQLIGGAGVYRATHAHAGFIHVDVRGSRARWGAL